MAKTVTVAIVGYPGCSAWITAGLFELFAIANNARATLGNRAASTARFDCHIVGRSRHPVRSSHAQTLADRWMQLMLSRVGGDVGLAIKMKLAYQAQPELQARM